MYNTNPQPVIQIEQNDISTFKTLALLFALSRIISIFSGVSTLAVGTVIGTLITAIINLGGIACLTYGIFLLARKYTQLSSGLKATYLFVLLIVVLLIQSLFNLLFPTKIPTTSTQGTTSGTAVLGAATTELSKNFIPTLIITIAIAVVTLVAAYYFTLWLDIIFSFNKTKTFYYYGLFLLIGSIISQVGIFLITQNSSATTVNGTTSATLDPALLMGTLVLSVGGVIDLAALILVIVAGFKIYNRANDLMMGKTAPKMYRPPYANPNYQPNTAYANQQFNNQVPYQNPNQNPSQTTNPNTDLNPNKTYDTNSGPNNTVNPTATSGKFCKYCGMSNQPESKFCQSCGARLE